MVAKAEKMIPTGYRDKLSKRLSYPVGAEEISNSLADAGDLRPFSLSFCTARSSQHLSSSVSWLPASRTPSFARNIALLASRASVPRLS